MAWSRLDDGLDENEKVDSFSDKAFRIWIYSITLSSRRHTHGVLSPVHVKMILFRVGGSQRHVDELVNKGGWERVDGGYAIHDYHDYNPKDPGAADRMKRFRDRNAGRNDDRNATRNAVTGQAVTSLGRVRDLPSQPVPDPYPTPSLPPPDPAQGEMGKHGNGGPEPETDEERAMHDHLTKMHLPQDEVDRAVLAIRRKHAEEGG